MTNNPTILRARAMRRALTPPESRLWVALRRLRAEGFHFRRQAPFQHFFLDFVCHTRRLAIEVDGQHHGEPRQAAHDAKRDAVLAGEGYRTLRFAASDVLGNLDGVMVSIRLALNQDLALHDTPRHGPPPGTSCHPPHEGEGIGPPPGVLRHPPHQGEGEGID